ncbi:unnamed protein product [Calicophoron daubneyi]|uniref:Uncharacterized protein n=1 Tax=Calicophoron daubneyi TaxID=300641 RepID=A0AAV2TZG3_CALDB
MWNLTNRCELSLGGKTMIKERPEPKIRISSTRGTLLTNFHFWAVIDPLLVGSNKSERGEEGYADSHRWTQ